jgi:hypothetical protein
MITTAARAAYEMQRAVMLARAVDLRLVPEIELAFPPWEALPAPLQAERRAQIDQALNETSDAFDRYFVGAARMTLNLLAELEPPLVAAHPAPEPPTPMAA